MLDIHIRYFLIHFYKGKQVCDDLIFSVDLRRNILHKLLVQFLRNPFLSHQGIRKDFHGG